MNLLTGDFDLALQIRTSAIGRILSAQHRAGVMLHSYSRAGNSRLAHVLVNVPGGAIR